MRNLSYRLVNKNKLSELKHRIKELEGQIGAAQSFIKEIESGNLSIDLSRYFTNGADNALGTALQSMRDQMSKIADEEKKRNWATEGLAKFVDILRSKNDNLKELGEIIITNIIRYMQANQGALYILNDDDQADVHLELIGCYAYDRKKHRDHRIGLGDGLAGQAVLEKGIVYLTNLPGDYLKITSGLGAALPRNLMIVPLMMNEKVYGVIELASFSTFERHHREFIQKLAESIASTISSVRVNQQTRKLLEDTQAQAEEMRSQEEEMRQNMEELTATQEEMQRVLKEVQTKEGYLNGLINASTDAIFTVDREIKLVSWNKVFQRTQESSGISIFKGYDILRSLPEQERDKNRAYYKKALNGESFELKQDINLNGNEFYFLIGYSPLRNANDQVTEVAVFAKDITEMVRAQQKAEKLMSEAQHQTEELKAQEEELRQNMEELSATQEEMHRVLKEVEGQEAYVKQLLNSSTDSIFTIDKEYRLITWNHTFGKTLEKFGMKLEKGISTLDWYMGDERTKQIDLYNRALRGESFEFTASSDQNGTTSYFHSVYTPLRTEKGEVFEVAIFAKDVTATMVAQRKTEQLVAEIQAKESYLDSILNASKDSIFTLDRDYKLISANTGFTAGLSQIGISAGTGFAILDLFPEAEQKAEQTRYYERAFGGESFEVTSKFNINETTSYFTSSFAPLRDAEGKIFAISVFGKDVTELMVSKNKAEAMAVEARELTEEMKAQEEELRQNLEELSAGQEEMARIMNGIEAREAYTNGLLNACDDMIFTIDRDFKLVSWNKTFAASLEAYGTVLQKGMNTLDWYPDEKQRKEQKRIYNRALQGESFEHTITSDINGTTYYFRNAHKPLKNENGDVFEVAIFARDITGMQQNNSTKDKLHAEMERREKFMQEVINGCRYDIYIIDTEFKFVNFNESFKKTLQAAGIPLERGGDALSNIPNKKEREAVRKQLERTLKGEGFDQIQEFTVNGDVKHVLIHYKPIKAASGEVIAAGIYSEDISELMSVKKMNKELLQQVRNQN